MSRILLLVLASLLLPAPIAAAGEATEAESASRYDAALAKSLGADERGMRSYVLVVLKTGPTRVPDGDRRKQMFEGHFANMQRLADEGKLVFAGPLDGVDGWRGIFVFATEDIATAKSLVATDPVIENGEMVAEYHVLYGSAALMQVNDIHDRISRESP